MHFAADLAQLGVLDGLAFFMECEQEEVHPAGESAAEIVNAYRTTVRERIRKKWRYQQDLEPLGNFRGGRRERRADTSPRQFRFTRPEAAKRRIPPEVVN